jgi:hypothetical protein
MANIVPPQGSCDVLMIPRYEGQMQCALRPLDGLSAAYQTDADLSIAASKSGTWLSEVQQCRPGSWMIGHWRMIRHGAGQLKQLVPQT